MHSFPLSDGVIIMPDALGGVFVVFLRNRCSGKWMMIAGIFNMILTGFRIKRTAASGRAVHDSCHSIIEDQTKTNSY
jgi:hypothetical protein